MQIKLVRHGESQTNTGEIPYGSVADHSIELTEPKGRFQATEAGYQIGKDFFSHCLLYSSPYMRARQTMQEILNANNIDFNGSSYPIKGINLPHTNQVYEDPRLRELDHGYDDVDEQEWLRKKHGWFYYRFKGGESPSDCYDRLSSFLETMMRQVKRKSIMPLGESRKEPNVLIVTHGLTIRCFVMRFLHLSPEQFETLANPKNCDIITLGKNLKNPQFASGKWGVEGLRFRKSPSDTSEMDARK